MAKSAAKAERAREPLIGHGAKELPSVTVTSYNLELRDKNGFVGDRASKRAFAEKLDDWREKLQKIDADPLGDVDTSELSKKQLDAVIAGKDSEAAAVIHGAIEDFAQELALGRPVALLEIVLNWPLQPCLETAPLFDNKR